VFADSQPGLSVDAAAEEAGQAVSGINVQSSEGGRLQ
jgi:putative Holliday junction resolvase